MDENRADSSRLHSDTNLQSFLLAGQHPHDISVAPRDPVESQRHRHENAGDERRNHHQLVHQDLSLLCCLCLLFFLRLFCFTLVLDQLRLFVSRTEVFLVPEAATCARPGAVRLNQAFGFLVVRRRILRTLQGFIRIFTQRLSASNMQNVSTKLK